MPPYSDTDLLDAVPTHLAELLGRAGEGAAVRDSLRLVEAIERRRAIARPDEWAAWDEAQDRALRTWRYLRDRAPRPAGHPVPARRVQPLPRGLERARLLPRQPPRGPRA